MTRQKKNLKTVSVHYKNTDLILKMLKKASIFRVRVPLTKGESDLTAASCLGVIHMYSRYRLQRGITKKTLVDISPQHDATGVESYRCMFQREVNLALGSKV